VRHFGVKIKRRVRGFLRSSELALAATMETVGRRELAIEKPTSGIGIVDQREEEVSFRVETSRISPLGRALRARHEEDHDYCGFSGLRVPREVPRYITNLNKNETQNAMTKHPTQTLTVPHSKS